MYGFIENGPQNQGLLESLSAQLPEALGIELYEVIDDSRKDELSIKLSFLDSLMWPRATPVKSHIEEYINNSICKSKDTFDGFLTLIFSVAGDEHHHFNGEYLHKWLIDLSLPHRDAVWTKYISEKSSYEEGIGASLSWIFQSNYHKRISKRSRLLLSKAIAWLLASTDIGLRDKATRSLVLLLIDEIDVAFELLESFRNVNDPYVYERILASIYGATLNSTNFNGLKKVSEHLYQEIFSKQEVYPNVLVRDYARNILEYSLYRNIFKLENPMTIRPPYRSKLDTNFPSNQEIERYEIDASVSEYYLSQNAILWSMVTEYGRGIGAYGDFGRYTFQSALNMWSNQDSNLLSNYACHLVFEKFGYDVNIHGEFDRTAPQGNRNQNVVERIGKKYQWLALYEIVARISDNIAVNKKYIPQVDDRYYQGPWQNYLRNIDPTFIGYKESEIMPCSISTVDYNNWNGPNSKWLISKRGLPNPIEMIDLGEFLSLESMYSWDEKDEFGFEDLNGRNKHLWYQVRSYIVKEEDYSSLFKWLSEQHFMGRWMPESLERYSIFALEHYWSPAYKDAMSEHGDNDWRAITANRNDWGEENLIAKVLCTAESHRSEGEASHSFLAPQSEIFRGTELTFNKTPGVFYGADGKIECFDPSIFGEYRSELLIRKKLLQKYLADNGMRVVWTVLAEKQILSGSIPTNSKWLELSGVYYLDGDDIKGKVTPVINSTYRE